MARTLASWPCLGGAGCSAALEALRTAAPTDDELARARAVRLALLEGAGDDVRGLTDLWLTAIVLGNGTPQPEQERAALLKVTAEDVHRLARAVLKSSTLRWVVSGERGAATGAVEGNKLGRLRALLPGR